MFDVRLSFYQFWVSFKLVSNKLASNKHQTISVKALSNYQAKGFECVFEEFACEGWLVYTVVLAEGRDVGPHVLDPVARFAFLQLAFYRYLLLHQ